MAAHLVDRTHDPHRRVRETAGIRSVPRPVPRGHPDRRDPRRHHHVLPQAQPLQLQEDAGAAQKHLAAVGHGRHRVHSGGGVRLRARRLGERAFLQQGLRCSDAHPIRHRLHRARAPQPSPLPGGPRRACALRTAPTRQACARRRPGARNERAARRPRGGAAIQDHRRRRHRLEDCAQDRPFPGARHHSGNKPLGRHDHRRHARRLLAHRGSRVHVLPGHPCAGAR